MNFSTIPKPVITVVGDVLASWDTHNGLEVLFLENGAPDEVPGGNKVVKCQAWLAACNSSPTVDPFKILGGIVNQHPKGASEPHLKEPFSSA